MRVRALYLGYYGESRRRAGDVFVLKDEKHYSSKWMERIDKPKVEAVQAVEPAPAVEEKPKGKPGRKPKSSGDVEVI